MMTIARRLAQVIAIHLFVDCRVGSRETPK
jgi:hypothetical protein